MKNLRLLLLASIAWLLPSMAMATAFDLSFSQKNSSDTAWITRIFAPNTVQAVTDTNTFRQAIGTAFNQVIAESAGFSVTAAMNGAIFNVTTGASNVTATLPTGAAGLFFILRKADAGAGGVVTSPASGGLFVQGHSMLVYWDPAASAWITRSWFGSESATGAITITSGSAISLTAGGTNQNVTITPSGTGLTVLQFAATKAVLGQFSGDPVLFLGPTATTPSSTNFTLASDSGNTFLNTTGNTGAIFFQSGNVTRVTMLAAGGLTLLSSASATAGLNYGSDAALYRISAGDLALDHVGGSNPELDFYASGVFKAVVAFNSGSMVVQSTTNLVLKTNGSTSVTFSTSQNSTFGGSITTTAGTTNAAGAWKLGALRSSTALVASTTQVIQLDVGGTLYSLMTCSTNP